MSPKLSWSIAHRVIASDSDPRQPLFSAILLPFETSAKLGGGPSRVEIPRFSESRTRLTTMREGTTLVAGVDEFLRSREVILEMVQKNLKKSQNTMKRFADIKRKHKEFSVGDMVYLKLQPYRQISVAQRRDLKLAPRFYGPYHVVERIGSVAYRLNLPPECLIHPVFHVSQLKKYVGNQDIVVSQIPYLDVSGKVISKPVAVLQRRLVKRKGIPAAEWLVQWEGQEKDDATWEYYEELKTKFPELIGTLF